MRVFITGATGFIGMALTRELIGAGHRVVGVYRSDEKAKALAALGAEPYRGSIAEPESLAAGAARADAVVHLAFNHDDFSRFVQNCEDDRNVVATLGAALAGSGRPLVITSGTPIANTIPGETAREGNPIASSATHPRAATEEAGNAVAAAGGNVSVVRLPQVHDTHRFGLVSPAIEMYRERGACFYVGDGAVRWPAAHYLDVARLYRLALERGEPNARYHAVGEEGVPMRAIAETIGRRLNLPVKSIEAAEAGAYFGWLAMFATTDSPASSAQTQEKLGWTPTGPGILADLERMEA
jgi:nucleoside-diphosphate-sugar epimerase